MAIRIQPQQIENPQQIEAVVSGPDGANRMFVFTGIVPAQLGAFNNSQKETFTFLVGPVLTRRQFHKAVATASLASIAISANPQSNASFAVNTVDADWDDESGQVEVRIEVSVSAQAANHSASVFRVGYQATVLAELQTT